MLSFGAHLTLAVHQPRKSNTSDRQVAAWRNDASAMRVSPPQGHAADLAAQKHRDRNKDIFQGSNPRGSKRTWVRHEVQISESYATCPISSSLFLLHLVEAQDRKISISSFPITRPSRHPAKQPYSRSSHKSSQVRQVGNLSDRASGSEVTSLPRQLLVIQSCTSRVSLNSENNKLCVENSVGSQPCCACHVTIHDLNTLGNSEMSKDVHFIYRGNSCRHGCTHLLTLPRKGKTHPLQDTRTIIISKGPSVFSVVYWVYISSSFQSNHAHRDQLPSSLLTLPTSFESSAMYTGEALQHPPNIIPSHTFFSFDSALRAISIS